MFIKLPRKFNYRSKPAVSAILPRTCKRMSHKHRKEAPEELRSTELAIFTWRLPLAPCIEADYINTEIEVLGDFDA